MPHRLPLHVQAQRLPLVTSDPIAQPFHDLVVLSALMQELDQLAASMGIRRLGRSPARILRCPPVALAWSLFEIDPHVLQ